MHGMSKLHLLTYVHNNFIYVELLLILVSRVSWMSWKMIQKCMNSVISTINRHEEMYNCLAMLQ